MGCRHGPQSQSGEVMTTHINTVDSDLQNVQKHKYTRGSDTVTILHKSVCLSTKDANYLTD